VDKQGGIHLNTGKISFPEEKLIENTSVVIEAINEARPSSVKGKFIKSLFLSSTMSPSLRIAC
jgi:large subunit ribosomal protein L1